MPLIDTLIVTGLATIMLGFPTLLVAMAAITRTKPEPAPRPGPSIAPTRPTALRHKAVAA
jgi:hypothetical protein